MKKMLMLLIMASNYFVAVAQNVGIGTTTPEGKLHIKGGADTSQLIIDASITQSNAHPLILLRSASGLDLLQIHSDNRDNVFIGVNAGQNNTLGGGAFNGTGNTFVGTNAGIFNTTGYSNTANGNGALYNNNAGNYNTANGYVALFSNSTGSYNTANGFAALNHATGNYNTANGASALQNTMAASYNTALGYNAGYYWDNGYNNVFVGANTDVNGAGYYNVIAIGQGTICTGSSQVTMGNGATGVYRTFANWSNISDGRYKKNVQENVPGLDFINKLRPVTYNLDATGLDVFLRKNNQAALRNDKRSDGLNRKMAAPQANDAAAKAVYNKALKEKESNVYTGFVAQEVEATAKKLGFNFSGVDAPKNENDVYGLRYAEFVVPLVKAVQEQQQQLEALRKKNENQQDINHALQKQIDQLKVLINK